MTRLSEQDLQIVSGGITRMTQNDGSSSNSGPAARPEAEGEQAGSEAK